MFRKNQIYFVDFDKIEAKSQKYREPYTEPIKRMAS